MRGYGGGCTEVRPHSAASGIEGTGHRGLDGVAQRSREAGEGVSRAGRPRRPGVGGGIRASNLATPNLESRTRPGEFWFIFISCLITF